MTLANPQPVPVPPAPLEPLKAYRQFITVKLIPQAGGKTKKLPVSPFGQAGVNAHAPVNWQSFDDALALAQGLGPDHTVGFVLTPEAGVWCLDMDNCLQSDGSWSAQSLEVVNALPGAAVEVSQSGRGLHIWGSGPVPEHSCKGPAGSGLELYTEARFIALGTGLDAAKSSGRLGNAPGIAAVVEQFFKPAPRAGAQPVAANDAGPCSEWRGPTDDDELIARALSAPTTPARAFSGAPHFRDLWNADADALGRAFPSGRPGEPYDASRADMALAGELAYWTGRDRERIECLMRKSALAREKWDEHPTYLSDFTIAKAGAAGRPVLQDRQPDPPPVPVDPAVLFAPVSIADLWENPPAPQSWVWDGLIPAGELTLLASHGGIGKSRLALALAAHVVLGRQFLGRQVAQGRVIVVSAEDGPGTVRRRLAAHCHAAAIDPRTLASAGLEVWDATQHDPALFAPSGSNAAAAATEAGKELARRLELARPALVVVDNASDTYAGNEIDRRDVRAFVQWLVRTVRPWGGAVLLLAHVAKTTSRQNGRPEDDEGYSGSTAWNNSSRSRLFLAKDPDREGALCLRHQKSNLGPLAPAMTFCWPQGGLPQLIESPAQADPEATMRALVALVGQAHAAAQARGEQYARLSPSITTANCAGKVLSEMPGWPSGLSWRDGHSLLERAEREGYLQRPRLKTGKGKDVGIWAPAAK